MGVKACGSVRTNALDEASMEAPPHAERVLEVRGRAPCPHGFYVAATRMEPRAADADDLQRPGSPIERKDWPRWPAGDRDSRRPRGGTASNWWMPGSRGET